MLRHLIHLAALHSDEPPDKDVWMGMTETAEEIEERTRAVINALPAEALAISVAVPAVNARQRRRALTRKRR